MSSKTQRMKAWNKMKTENDTLRAQVTALQQENRELRAANKKLARWIEQNNPYEQSPLGIIKPRAK